MRKLYSWLMCLLFALGAHAAAMAAVRGTPEEAMALVKKAAMYLKAHGKDKAFAEFNDTKGQFVDRDLYIFVYDLKGTNLAIGNGRSDKMVGKNLYDMRDVDGVYLIKAFIDTANANGKGWVDYRWPNPRTDVMERKSSYVMKAGDMLIGCGAYKAG